MTRKQYKLLSFIRNSILHFGKAPTFVEMKKYMEVSSNQTISDWLSILVREGYLQVAKGKFRGIEMSDDKIDWYDSPLQMKDKQYIKKLTEPILTQETVVKEPVSFPESCPSVSVSFSSGIELTWKGGGKDGSS